MRSQCGLRAEPTEAAVEAARKSPVSRTRNQYRNVLVFYFRLFHKGNPPDWLADFLGAMNLYNA